MLRRSIHQSFRLQHQTKRHFFDYKSFFPSFLQTNVPTESIELRENNTITQKISINGKEMSFEIGKLARLASGSVIGRYGDCVVLTTAVSSNEESEFQDFLPLSVDYREKYYSTGSIPKTRSRRETMSDAEILKSRVLDRSIRPLFPQGYFDSTHVVSTIQSSDRVHDQLVLAINSASVALAISDIPWNGPIGCVRICRILGDFVINPTIEEQAEADLDILYAASKERTLMIEANGKEINEDEVAVALKKAHEQAIKIANLIDNLRVQVGKPKRSYNDTIVPKEIQQTADEYGMKNAMKLFQSGQVSKQSRVQAETVLQRSMRQYLGNQFPHVSKRVIETALHQTLHVAIRNSILQNGKFGKRFDGRTQFQVRPLELESSVLPSSHGSAIFGRGDTQALCTVTLGSDKDALNIDSPFGGNTQNAILHYEFPPYSVNETGRIGGVNRRMIGHGALAEKAILPVLPSVADFPFAIRMTSEVTMSDGSSSMATACGVSMALKNAGVPITNSVAGISVGLVTEGDPFDGKKDCSNYVLLTDILGTEDHFGDMDFKIAGTSNGVTALQLDVKLPGVPLEILVEALQHGKVARNQILEAIDSQNIQPTDNSKIPSYTNLKIAASERGRVIGTGGATIREIENSTNTSIRIKDDDDVSKLIISIYGTGKESLKAAENRILALANTDKDSTTTIIVEAADRGRIIGIGGKTISEIEESTDTKISINDHDTDPSKLAVSIVGRDTKAAENKIRAIRSMDANMATVIVDSSLCGRIIGAGGKTIKEIESSTGSSIRINPHESDSSKKIVTISGKDEKSVEAATQRLQALTFDWEKGSRYKLKVTKVIDFGVILTNNMYAEGFLHSSEFLDDPTTTLKVGDEVEVICIGTNPTKFSQKKLSTTSVETGPTCRVGGKYEVIVDKVLAHGILARGPFDITFLIHRSNLQVPIDAVQTGDKFHAHCIETAPLYFSCKYDSLPKYHRSVEISEYLIGRLIGKGGNAFPDIQQSLVERFECNLVRVGRTTKFVFFAPSKEQLEQAIVYITGNYEKGEKYDVTVVSFASSKVAVVESTKLRRTAILPLEEVTTTSTNGNIGDHLRIGDTIQVKCISTNDRTAKVSTII